MEMPGQQPQPQEQPQEQAQGQDPEALAQQIMSGVQQLQQMVPAEIFAGFVQQLSTGGQPQEQAPQRVGAVQSEAGVSGQPRL